MVWPSSRKGPLPLGRHVRGRSRASQCQSGIVCSGYCDLDPYISEIEIVNVHAGGIVMACPDAVSILHLCAVGTSTQSCSLSSTCLTGSQCAGLGREWETVPGRPGTCGESGAGTRWG